MPSSKIACSLKEMGTSFSPIGSMERRWRAAERDKNSSCLNCFWAIALDRVWWRVSLSWAEVGTHVCSEIETRKASALESLKWNEAFFSSNRNEAGLAPNQFHC